MLYVYMSTSMLGWIAGVLTVSLLLKAYHNRKRMGLSVLIYLIILTIDLMVGGGLIVWKCVLTENAEECQIAYGGTVGSVVIWLVVMNLCPLCMTKWSVFDVVDSVRLGIKHQLEKIRPSKDRQWIEKGLLLPSLDTKKGFKITGLDENRNGIVVDSNISVIPRGRGTIRGVPEIVYTSNNNKESNNKDTKVNGSLKANYAEIDET